MVHGNAWWLVLNVNGYFVLPLQNLISLFPAFVTCKRIHKNVFFHFFSSVLLISAKYIKRLSWQMILKFNMSDKYTHDFKMKFHWTQIKTTSIPQSLQCCLITTAPAIFTPSACALSQPLPHYLRPPPDKQRRVNPVLICFYMYRLYIFQENVTPIYSQAITWHKVISLI